MCGIERVWTIVSEGFIGIELTEHLRVTSQLSKKSQICQN